MANESRPGGLARSFVRGIDLLLRRLYGVYEYSQDPVCILRVSPARARADLVLADGTPIARGDPLAVIHFWNDRLPLAPPEGVDLRWARTFHRRIRPSLQLLAQHLAHDPRLASIRALCGEAAFIGADNATASAHLLSRLGFEVWPSSRGTGLWGRWSAFWQNTYTWMLIWTFNPATLRGRTMLDLERHWLWMSRATFDRLYGSGADLTRGGADVAGSDTERAGPGTNPRMGA